MFLTYFQLREALNVIIFNKKKNVINLRVSFSFKYIAFIETLNFYSLLYDLHADFFQFQLISLNQCLNQSSIIMTIILLQTFNLFIKRYQTQPPSQTYIILPHMIQEQPIQTYHFIKGSYASIKIKMEPQSLLLDVPLEWQINKIKCLLIRTLFKLQFDMFSFQHDGEEIPGEMTLAQVIERDRDEQCIGGDHYVLTFVKNQRKNQQFDKYYLTKMRPLITALENSPFQPILHPAYYNMKYLNHINHIPFQGARQLIVNFNHLQQMQNVIQQHRRDNQNAAADNVAGMGIGIGVDNNIQNNNANGGWMQWVAQGFIRFIQIISILSIIQFLYAHSNMEVFICLALLTITYFTIDFFKKRNKNAQNQAQINQEPAQNNNNVQEQSQQSSALGKFFFTSLVFITERSLLVIESIIAYALSLFPNWTVQIHQEWFKGIHESIQLKLNSWKIKIGSQNQLKFENNMSEPTSGDGEIQQTNEQVSVQQENTEGIHKVHEQ